MLIDNGSTPIPGDPAYIPVFLLFWGLMTLLPILGFFEMFTNKKIAILHWLIYVELSFNALLISIYVYNQVHVWLQLPTFTLALLGQIFVYFTLINRRKINIVEG